MELMDRLGSIFTQSPNKVHIAMIILTILLIPGALRALEPIDMESYDMETPELAAQSYIDESFPNSELIVAFIVNVKQEQHFTQGEWEPIPSLSDGAPDYSSLPTLDQIADSGEEWRGISSPSGGILNLSALRDIDNKQNIILEHTLSSSMKPMVNDVTGLSNSGVMSLADIFRGFMNNTSFLTQPSRNAFGEPLPPLTNWTDCGDLECLEFDDQNVTQAHIDLAASRMVDASSGTFLRWLSVDRGFRADLNSNLTGLVGGELNTDGTWSGGVEASGRWSASSTWIIVQFDRTELENNGWTQIWKDAHQETAIRFDDGLRVGGYRLVDGGLVVAPPQYNTEICLEFKQEGDGACSIEWGIMDLEGKMRSEDYAVVSMQVGQSVNVEVNRELQSSAGLILLMGLVITILLYASLRRVSDVGIVLVALGGAMIWMQGLIGTFASITEAMGFSLIARSQFSNLLPILVLALGIDDSLHALHRYKEERILGKTPEQSSQITLRFVGKAILLTSVTTIAAFSANLFSDIAALRSFGIEASFGIFSALVLTGIWTPLLRMSLDKYLEKREKSTVPDSEVTLLVPKEWPEFVAKNSGSRRNALAIAFIAILLTIPAAFGMASLEGDFAVEDFLDDSTEFAEGIYLVTERFSDEGEPAAMLITGDVLDPRVYAAIDELRQNMNTIEEGVPDKMAKTADGNVDILAMDEIVSLAIYSMIENPEPYEEAGWVSNETGFGMNCSENPNTGLPDTTDRDCLAFFYGYTYLNGIPASTSVPHIPNSIVSLYINPTTELDPSAPWMDVNGEEAVYDDMIIRFGIIRPEHFPSMGPGLEEVWRDLSAFTNLSSGTFDETGELSEDTPVTWVMLTGKPVIRYEASTQMQDEMQSSLLLGALFVFIVLSIGFGSPKQAMLSLGPIMIVVVWLYGLMYIAGASLNIVTVTIATISLGVGIDYCIHVNERYKEERNKGRKHSEGLISVGGACGLALVGSAASDIAGFSVIALSPMGLFSSFGVFSSAMIALSLFASLVLTTAALGILYKDEHDSAVIAE